MHFPAIAASAPILGFPLDSCPLDGSAVAVTRAASAAGGAAVGCAGNLKASYVLLSDVGKTADGRRLLSEELNLCSPLKSQRDVQSLLYYLQSPLFNLAEGSYPFPSSYITFALTSSDDLLPAWPMRVMCDPIGQDFEIELLGDTSVVQFTVSAGQSAVEVFVDWNETRNNGYTLDALANTQALELLKAVADGIQIWYNVSGDQPQCINWEGDASAYMKDLSRVPAKLRRGAERALRRRASRMSQGLRAAQDDSVCQWTADEFSADMGWYALTCKFL
jgi:hypothetical protein